jgi:hypothetical protein
MSRSRKRAAIVIALFALLHFILSAGAFMVSFGAAMNQFDFGGQPTAVERLAERMASILFFPGYQFATAANIHNNAVEWLLVLGNSLLWGAALYGVFIVVRRTIRVFRSFSLRTLLIATTLVAVVLGLVVYGAGR